MLTPHNSEAIDQDRRRLLGSAAMGLAIAGTISLFHAGIALAGVDSGIRPFSVKFPEESLLDLRRRINATRWPDRETVSDQSQGIQLAKLQPLVRYWGTELRLAKDRGEDQCACRSSSPTIDGVDIHFIHVRSRHPNALPLIMSLTAGRDRCSSNSRSSVRSRIPPPMAGGLRMRSMSSFPSMPGYGFSGKPTGTGWGPDHIARVWAELMKRLGYTHYVAQGGDWGSPVSSAMARQAPAGLLGIHINLPAIVPPEIAAILAAGGPAPAGLSEKERAAFDALSAAGKMGNRSYAVMMGTRPQTIGYGLTDSPVGLAAWMLGHPGLSHWTYDDSDPEKSLDEVLDDITLYWLTKALPRLRGSTGSMAGAVLLFPARRRPPRSRSPWRSRSFRARAIKPPRPGPGAPIATWSIFTRSTRAVISRRGSSRSSSPPSFARHSDRFGLQSSYRIQFKDR